MVAWIIVPAFDVAVFWFWGAKALVYMALGTWIGVGLHPIAGHVISEHVQLADGQETFSCYDKLLNPLLYNFGYHVEHHDFPSIPWNRLPNLRKIAPEFYEPLRSYNSWTYVMYEFLTRRDVAQTGIMTKRPDRAGSISSTMIPASALGKGVNTKKE